MFTRVNESLREFTIFYESLGEFTRVDEVLKSDVEKRKLKTWRKNDCDRGKERKTETRKTAKKQQREGP